MSKETAEGFFQVHVFDSAPCTMDCMMRYGDLRAQEEREKLLAELRQNPQEAYAQGYDAGLTEAVEKVMQEAKAELLAEWRADGLEEWLSREMASREAHQLSTWPVIREALARARAQGAAKAKAELHEVQSLIHRQEPKAHTTTCAVHGSRACDCGGN